MSQMYLGGNRRDQEIHCAGFAESSPLVIIAQSNGQIAFAALGSTISALVGRQSITMARMERLFGVTMAEQGVGKLVSVDLQAAEQLR